MCKKKINDYIQHAANDIKAGLAQQREHAKNSYFSVGENKLMIMMILRRYYAYYDVEIPREVIRLILRKDFHVAAEKKIFPNIHHSNFHPVKAAYMVCDTNIDAKDIIECFEKEENKIESPAYIWFSHVLKIARKEECQN